MAIWSLDCEACSDYLRSDPLWSDTIAELPETYDEQKAREDFDKRGVTDERALMAMALAKLTGLDLPETLAARITGHKAHIPLPETVSCPDGHPNLPGAKFCNECGGRVGDALKATAAILPVPVDDPPPAPQNGSSAPSEPAVSAPAVSLPSNTQMRQMKREQLAALATAAGVDAGGSRADVLERLIAANNAGKAA